MQRLFSGIQPSGNLHLGNYLGAIKQWVELQEKYEAIFCVVDLHAITVPQDPAELRKKTLEIAKIYLAAGIDPNKSTMFIQSHVPAHTELGWILNTVATMGELERMTQFADKAKLRKLLEAQQVSFGAYLHNVEVIEGDLVRDFALEEKSNFTRDEVLKMFKNFREGVERPLLYEMKSKEEARLNREEAGVGLFDYPVLMAADILLYDTAVVPVGEDQKQHVELTRDLAQRFNSRFGEIFVIPEPVIQKESARIMGLDDPTKKMSKSAASEYNYIALTDDADTVRRKIKKAVTDSGSEVIYSDDKPALKNLINIYTLLSGKSTDDIRATYVGKGYGDFKSDLAEVVVDFLTPFQERLAALSDDEVLMILKQGAEKVKPLAESKLQAVYDTVGFIR